MLVTFVRGCSAAAMRGESEGLGCGGNERRAPPGALREMGLAGDGAYSPRPANSAVDR